MEEDLKELKIILKSVVISFPGKLTIRKLNRDYHKSEGRDIPYRDHGFESLELFLKSMPDTLKVSGTGIAAIVEPVKSEKSGHLVTLVKEQKKHLNRRKLKTESRKPHFKQTGRTINQPYSHKQVTYHHVVKHAEKSSTLQTKCSSLMSINTFDVQVGAQEESSEMKNYEYKSNNNDESYTENNQALVASSDQNFVFLQKNQDLEHMRPSIPRKYPKQQLQIYNPIRQLLQQHKTLMQQQNIQTLSKDFNQHCKITNKRALVEIDGGGNLLLDTTNIAAIRSSSEVSISSDISSLGRNKASLRKDSYTTSSTDNDLNEVVTAFAGTDVVHQLECPSDCASFGKKVPYLPLSPEITINSVIKIYITEIHNPYKFWYHLYKENDELITLMQKLNNFYKENGGYELATVNQVPGQLCAVLFSNIWHRGEIVGTPIKDNVKVHLFDYGTVANINVHYVKYLHNQFICLPSQTFRGSLSHVKPFELHWTPEASKYFTSLIKNKVVFAKITEVNEQDRVCYMILCDKFSDGVVQINRTLIDRRYAKLDPNWEAIAIELNDYCRRRHPREDFPTFAMLESGEYPNLDELIDLKEHGIDYELIYDQLIFNNTDVINKLDSVAESVLIHWRHLNRF